MSLDRNAVITVTGTLGHALPLRLGDLMDEIRDEVLGEFKKALVAEAASIDAARVRPT